jgi:hypothetical protein
MDDQPYFGGGISSILVEEKEDSSSGRGRHKALFFFIAFD